MRLNYAAKVVNGFYLSLPALWCPSQFINVYSAEYELGGGYWPHFHSRAIASMVMAQAVLISVFSLRYVIGPTICLLPLPLVTLLFNHTFITAAFKPTFKRLALEVSGLLVFANPSPCQCHGCCPSPTGTGIVTGTVPGLMPQARCHRHSVSRPCCVQNVGGAQGVLLVCFPVGVAGPCRAGGNEEGHHRCSGAPG